MSSNSIELALAGLTSLSNLDRVNTISVDNIDQYLIKSDLQVDLFSSDHLENRSPPKGGLPNIATITNRTYSKDHYCQENDHVEPVPNHCTITITPDEPTNQLFDASGSRIIDLGLLQGAIGVFLKCFCGQQGLQIKEDITKSVGLYTELYLFCSGCGNIVYWFNNIDIQRNQQLHQQGKPMSLKRVFKALNVPIRMPFQTLSSNTNRSKKSSTKQQGNNCSDAIRKPVINPPHVEEYQVPVTDDQGANSMLNFEEPTYTILGNVVEALRNVDPPAAPKDTYQEPVEYLIATPMKDLWFGCNLCAVKMESAKEVKDHFKLLHRRKRLQAHCVKCAKPFKKLCNLETHVRLHTGEKPFHCSECKKYFSDKSSFSTHRKLVHHERLTVLKCPNCDKTFSRKQHFNEHQTVHTNAKPHQCQLCQKLFQYASSLKKHIRLHTKQYPYHCVLCPKKFNWLQSMKIHMECHKEASL